jgi:hypothetical protein
MATTEGFTKVTTSAKFGRGWLWLVVGGVHSGLIGEAKGSAETSGVVTAGASVVVFVVGVLIGIQPAPTIEIKLMIRDTTAILKLVFFIFPTFPLKVSFSEYQHIIN